MSDAVHILSCQVFESALTPLLNGTAPTSCRFMEYGLHSVPQQMAPQLQAAINAIEPPGVLLLGYGLCGNGIVGLAARGHTLIIPRVDDCIATLMGSYQAFMADFKQHPGTYYLSRGWLESGYHPVGQYRMWSAQYGEIKARRVVERMYENYRRVALVGFSAAELAYCRPAAQETAQFLGLAYDELLGSTALLSRWLERAAHRVGDDNDAEFVMVPPGGTVRQEMFIRPASGGDRSTCRETSDEHNR
jgi:hypothetical protein